MLEELIDHFRYYGVVGEENLCITAAFASLNGMSIGIEGKSGSGKTVIANALVNLLRDVKTIDLSSKKSFLYEDYSKTKYLYFPELQKSLTQNPFLRETLKQITEGKNASYSVTVGTRVEEKIIPAFPIIYTLATENKFKLDVELSRRVLQLKTDDSKEQQKRVKENKARNRGGKIILGKPYVPFQDFSLKTHDPIAEELTDNIPLKDIDNYYSLVDSSAHFFNRPITNEGKRMVFLEDHKLVRGLLGYEDTVDWKRVFGIASSKIRNEEFYNWFSNQANKIY